jgi:PAS domain S-box-containing protein
MIKNVYEPPPDDNNDGYRNLVHSSPSGIAVYQEGIIVYINPAGIKMMGGCKPADLLGRAVSSIIHPDSLTAVSARMQLVAEGQTLPSFEEKFIRLDGSVFDAEVSAIPTVYKSKSAGQVIVQDITQRKLDKEELVRREQLLNETESLAKTGGWEFELATKKLSWTREVYRIYELDESLKEVEVQAAFNQYLKSDRAKLENAFHSLVQQGIPYDLELKFLSTSGIQKWVRTIGKPVYVDGIITKVCGNIADITSRKIAEEKLEKYKQIVSSTPGPMALINREFQYEIVNETYHELSGIPCEELIGKTLEEFYGREVFTMIIKEKIERCLAGETVRFEEWLNYNLAGRRYMRITYFPHREKGEEITGVASIIQDLTDLKLADEENAATIELLRILNRSREKSELIREFITFLQQFLNCQAIGIRLSENGDFPYYETRGFPQEFVQTEKFLCSYGKDRQVLLDSKGDPVLECMCGNIIRSRFDPALPFFTAHGSFWSNHTTALLAETTDDDRQARTRNRCNGEGYESVGLFPLRFRTKTFGLVQVNDKRKNFFSPRIIMFLEHIADNLAIALLQMQTEEALRENEGKLLLLNASKDKLFSILAHDLRNPFNSILGFAELLGQNVRKYELEKTEKYISLIGSQARNTYNLLENLLVWARSQTGQQVFKLENFCLSLLLEKMVVEMGVAASAKNIKLRFNFTYNIEVSADINMTNTILRNLISNAIKYCNPGCEIEIIATCEAGFAKVCVQDNGIGMNEETCLNLFRIDTASSTKGTANEKGTGLGLIICKEFVEQQAGKIWVESASDKGSSFYFTLPLAIT